MSAVEEKTELIQSLFDAVVNMDDQGTAELSRRVLEEGIDAMTAVNEGLAAAMTKVGELYVEKEYFVPELLLCADALYAGLEVLRPHIQGEESNKRRTIIIGTIEGDVHDIGKNLVKVMFEAGGWEVCDLGVDVRLSRFVEEQKRLQADVIALSALMTTSMLAMPKLIEMIRAEDEKVAIMVGGAPLSAEIARDFGADGYADNAGEAVGAAGRMLKRMNK
jgi:methanogenic corrinoid protein MtbC1